jgi:hypothetical protein
MPVMGVGQGRPLWRAVAAALDCLTWGEAWQAAEL